MTENKAKQTDAITNRPVLFTFFCILSFISNGFMLIVGLAGIFLSGYIYDQIEKYSPGGGSLGREWLLIISFSTLLLFGMKLWGTILMFFGRKAGYILYLIPAGLLMILNIVMIFATYNFFAVGYLLICILFIAVYGVFFKSMK
jgi:hypothetical protein